MDQNLFKVCKQLQIMDSFRLTTALRLQQRYQQKQNLPEISPTLTVQTGDDVTQKSAGSGDSFSPSSARSSLSSGSSADTVSNAAEKGPLIGSVFNENGKVSANVGGGAAKRFSLFQECLFTLSFLSH